MSASEKSLRLPSSATEYLPRRTRVCRRVSPRRVSSAPSASHPSIRIIGMDRPRTRSGANAESVPVPEKESVRAQAALGRCHLCRGTLGCCGSCGSTAARATRRRQSHSRASCATQADPRPWSPTPSALAEQPAPTLGRIGGTLPETLVDPRLLAEKSRRTLTVFSDGRPVKTYRTASEGRHGRQGARGRRADAGGGVLRLREEPGEQVPPVAGSVLSQRRRRRARTRRQTDQQARAARDRRCDSPLPPAAVEHRLGGEIMVHGGGTAATGPRAASP